MWGRERLRAGQNWSSWSLTRHMDDESYLLNARYTPRSQSTVAGSEALPRLRSNHRFSAGIHGKRGYSRRVGRRLEFENQ